MPVFSQPIRWQEWSLGTEMVQPLRFAWTVASASVRTGPTMKKRYRPDLQRAEPYKYAAKSPLSTQTKFATSARPVVSGRHVLANS